MNDFEKLIELFNLLKVEYSQISSNEIIVPCPFGIADNEKEMFYPMDDTLKYIISDEVYIHIQYDKDSNYLNWYVIDYDSYTGEEK